MQVKFWGVRGSLPSAPSPEQWKVEIEKQILNFVKAGLKSESEIKPFIEKQNLTEIAGFGCHTTCVEVLSNGNQIIIDAGSALRNLGDEMMKGPAGQGKSKIHIYFTHFHWDHLIGLPFFAPHFIAGNEIHYYSADPELEKIIRIKFSKPMFPVNFDNLLAKIFFHPIKPREKTEINGIAVTPYLLDHPDPCWGLKVESNGKVYSHCVDTEATRKTREELGPDLPLYQNVNLMYFDAQYTVPELVEKLNWGHSAAQIGLEIAFRENIKQIVFAHHDPGAGTPEINALIDETKEFYNWKLKSAQTNQKTLPDVKWQFGYDGLSIKL